MWQVTLFAGDEHIEGLVRAKMQDWEVSHVLQVAKILKMVATFVSLNHVLKISMGITRENSITQDVLFYALYLTTLLLDTSPGLVCPGIINCLYVAGTVLGCAFLAPGMCPTEYLNVRMAQLKVVSFGLSICRLQVTVVAGERSYHSYCMCAFRACQCIAFA